MAKPLRYVPCPDCEDGWADDECAWCEGLGDDEDGNPCAYCDGTGIIEYLCLTCGGEGEIEGGLLGEL